MQSQAGQSQAELEAWSRKVAVVVVVLAAWMLDVLPPIGLAAAVPTGVVYVVQGLPDKSVYVAIDGRTVAVGAGLGAVVGPVKVPSGTRKLSAHFGDQVLLDSVFRVGPGQSVDVVMHRPASVNGAAVVTVFPNAPAGVPPGKGMLVVANTATVPPADITVNGRVQFANIANGEALNVVVPAGTYRVGIVPTGGGGPPILPTVTVSVRAGFMTRMFAVGIYAVGQVRPVVHVLAVPRSGTGRPTRIDSGGGGLAVRPAPAGFGARTGAGDHVDSAGGRGLMALAAEHDGVGTVRPARFVPTRIWFGPDRFAPVAPAKTVRGLLVLPKRVDQVGWWDGSAQAGDPFGATVIAGHLDSPTGSPGFFAGLLAVRPGQVVTVTGNGRTARYRISTLRTVPARALATSADAFEQGGSHSLVLITCAGRFDPGNGRYDRNLVVTAMPA
jgi:Sortase domain